MKGSLEGVGSPMDNLPDIVIEDERGNRLRISVYDALRLMELLEDNARVLE